MQKQLFFGVLCLLLLINETNFTFIVPILPDFLLKQGVSLTIIGFIMSFYQISYFFTSLYLGSNISSYSKTKVMIAGQSVIVISNIGLSLLDYNLNMVIVIMLASALRFIQGFALALVCAAIYAYVPMLFPHDLDKKYAVVEITLGCGLALGPVIGGFLYQFFGYFCAFMVMAVIYLLIAMVVFPFLIKIQKIATPHTRNSNLDIESLSTENFLPSNDLSFSSINDDVDYKCNSKKKTLQIRDIMGNKDFLMTFFVYFGNYMCYNLIQPGFSEHVHNYNGNDETVGLIFGIGDIAYAITGLVFLKFITSFHVKRKIWFLFGGIVSVASLLVLGPEEYTFLPKNLSVVTIGMGLLGFSQMFYTATLIPEYIEIFREMEPNAKGTDEMACGLFNASVAGTEFFGSILGGFLSDHFGFSRGMAIYAIFLFAYLVFFFYFRSYPEKKRIIQVELSVQDFFSKEEHEKDDNGQLHVIEKNNFL